MFIGITEAAYVHVCKRVKCRLINPLLRFHCSWISRTPGAETKLLMALLPLLSSLFPSILEMLCGLLMWW